MSDSINSQSSIRERVLKSVSLMIAAFVAIVALVNLLNAQNYLLATVEASISGLFIWMYYKTCKFQPLTWQPAVGALLITFGLLHGFNTAPDHTDIIFWAYPLPALYQLFFSRTIGAVSTFSMLGGIILIYYPEAIFHFEVSRSLINFVLPYIMIWAVAYSHEGAHITFQRHLANLARTDSLTGCLNRHALTQDWEAIALSGNQYLLHLDLDRFKQINDNYGHDVGDIALETFASITRKVLPSSQGYRMGGEEFCLFFPASNDESALATVELLRKSLQKVPVQLTKCRIHITFSGGLLSLKQNNGLHLDAAIKAADRATYQAKRQGRDKVLIAQPHLIN